MSEEQIKKDEELLKEEQEAPQQEQNILEVEPAVPQEEQVVQPTEEVTEPSEEKEGGKEEGSPEQETKEEKPEEEPKEEKEVKEEPQEEEPEVVKEEVDIEAIKAELEELKAEKQEQVDIEILGKENARVANEFNQLCQGLGKGLEEAFEKYSIPMDKTIEELEKEDPAKAQLAKNLTKQANDIIEAARKDAEAFLNEKAHEVVFKKADRLLQKMDISEEEAPIVAETFLDIIAQSGVKDLHDDLKAKLELAVAKAKMVAKKVGKTADAVKEHTEKVVEKIEKVEEIITDKKDNDIPAQQEEKAPEAQQKEEVIKPVEEIDKTEFEEGVNNKPQASSGLSIDNIVDKMLELPFKEQTKFYKEHYSLIEEAMKRRAR